jgi:TPR repeat protein
MIAMIVSLVVLVPVAAHADDLADGLAAYQAKDYAGTFLLLAPLADSGNADAEFVIGEMYLKGRGFVKSPAEALPYLRKAAEAGQVAAQVSLGLMYERGDGVDPDMDAALQWFQHAADSGKAEGQLNLALHYIRAEEHRDFEKAATLLKQAADQGDPEAEYFYARLLLDGRGIEANPEAARAWLQKSAGQHHVLAQRFLRVVSLPDGPDKQLELRELKRHIAAGIAQLAGVSDDAGYGVEEKNPVCAGQGYVAEWAYLNALRGPSGEVVYYRSLGQCCVFKTENAERGGFLDRYELTYDGLAKPVVLYMNMFSGELDARAPKGFGFVGDEGTVKP